MDAKIHREKRALGATLRTDSWWLEPMLVLLGICGYVGYSTWAAFQAEHYWAISYLSPLYSPLVYIKEGVAGGAPMAHSLLGEWPSWWPDFIPASPSFLILVFPGLFRFTCYYYLGAYYKAFAATPPGCAVGPIPQKKYRGETFLLIFQNLHRYAVYAALLYLPILTYDAYLGFSYNGQFGFGIGTIVLTLNATFIALYTLGCHSFRHLIGGRKDCFSCNGSGTLQNGVFVKVSWLNKHHKLFAWVSALWLTFTDIYIRMVSMGTWTDWNTWNI